jgi:hypothetical protein
VVGAVSVLLAVSNRAVRTGILRGWCGREECGD